MPVEDDGNKDDEEDEEDDGECGEDGMGNYRCLLGKATKEFVCDGGRIIVVECYNF